MTEITLTPRKKTLGEAIASDLSLAHFSLNLTAAEAMALKALRVNATTQHNNFAEPDELRAGAANFIASLGNSSQVAEQVSGLVERLTQEAVYECGTETAWMALRASLPHNGFNIPRWHPDGYLYMPYRDMQRKIAATLAGANTLFAKFSPEIAAEITRRAAKIEYDDLVGRAELAQFVAKHGRRETTEIGQGSVFTIGGSYAAIHSEPPIRDPRLFLSIVPGSRRQVMDFCAERWEAPGVI